MSKLIGAIYYVALAVIGSLVGLLALDGFLGQAVFVGFLAIGVVGLIGLLCFEVLEDDGGLYVACNVLRCIVSVAGFIFVAMIFYTGYREQCMQGAEKSTFLQALIHAFAFFPLVFILLRGITYAFTLENVPEEATFIVNIIFPVVCYALSVLMLTMSTVWSLVVLGVIWLVVNVFIKGQLNGFERAVFNLVYYGAFLAIGLSFAGTQNLLAVMAFVSMFFCFFLFIGIDLCREAEGAYWVFNIIGMLGALVFGIVALVFAGDSGLEGLESGLRCGFGDAVKNAWYFMPLVFVCLRPPLYKLAAESDWEEGLGDAFVSLLLPLLAYVLSIVFLMIGFTIVLAIFAVILLIVMVVMALTDNYAYIPDVMVDVRDTADGYIRSITIIED